MAGANDARWRVVLASAVPFAGYSGLALIYDALPPILVDVARHFGGGKAGQSVAQLASALPFFGVMTGGLAAPAVIQRFGLKATLLVSLLMFGISGSAGYLINDAWLLFATRFLLGLAIGVVLTCCATFIAVSFNDVTRARFNGWLMAWGCFTGILFVLISGYVAVRFSWRAPFLLHLFVALAFCAPVLAMRPIPIAGELRSFGSDLPRLRPVLPSYLTAIGLFSIQTVFFFQLSFLLTEAGHGDPTTIGRVFAIIGVAATAAAFAYSRWGPRFASKRSITLGLSLFGIGIFLTSLATSLLLMVAALCVYGAGSAVTQAALFTRVMQIAPADLAPRALGLVTTSLYFGGTIGPILLSPLLWYLDLRTLYLAFAATVGVWLALAAVRTRAQRAGNA